MDVLQKIENLRQFIPEQNISVMVSAHSKIGDEGMMVAAFSGGTKIQILRMMMVPSSLPMGSRGQVVG